MRFDDRVDVVHPSTGTVLAYGELANVSTVTGGAITERATGQVVGSIRELLVMLTPGTSYERGYVLRWLGVDWVPSGELLPVTRRGQVHHYQVTVTRKVVG